MMAPLKESPLFKGSIFRFHVNFAGVIYIFPGSPKSTKRLAPW